MLLKGLQQCVIADEPFSQALRVWPQIFPLLFPALMQVGKLTGQLDESCRQLAEQQHLRQKVVKALRYPLFILLVALTISAGMLLFCCLNLSRSTPALTPPLPAFAAGVMALSE